MTFEEFQNLGREERLRVQLDEMALVGATQNIVEDSTTDNDAMASLAKTLLAKKHSEIAASNASIHDALQRVDSQLSIETQIREALQSVVRQISIETQSSEATVLQVIESYERTP